MKPTPLDADRWKDRAVRDISRVRTGGRTDAQRVARFEWLWQELFPRVLGYALRRTDPEEARDVVAETFTVAWRRLEDVPPGDDALPWLLATACKQLANRRRATDTRTRLGDGPLATRPIARDPAEGVTHAPPSPMPSTASERPIGRPSR